MGLVHYSCNIYLLYHIHHTCCVGLFNSQISAFSLFLLLFDTSLILIYSIYFCGGIYLNLCLLFTWIIFLTRFVFLSVTTALQLMFAFYFNYRWVYLSHNLFKIHSDSYMHIISNFLNFTIVLLFLSPLF